MKCFILYHFKRIYNRAYHMTEIKALNAEGEKHCKDIAATILAIYCRIVFYHSVLLKYRTLN